MSIEKLKVRPYPGSFPRERENHSPAPRAAQSVWFSHAILPGESANGMNAMDFRAMRTAQLLLPLPGGAGRGEGGCDH